MKNVFITEDEFRAISWFLQKELKEPGFSYSRHPHFEALQTLFYKYISTKCDPKHCRHMKWEIRPQGKLGYVYCLNCDSQVPLTSKLITQLLPDEAGNIL